MGISLSTTSRTTTTTTLSHPLDLYPSAFPTPPYNHQPLYDYNEPHFIYPKSDSEDDDETKTNVVNSEVNVHNDSFKLEFDDLDPDRLLVSFVFDAMLDGSITIYYFAKEDVDRRMTLLFPETYVPIKVPFRKGLNQEFRQPPGTGIDFRFFSLDSLSSPSSRDDVFPIVVSAETYPSEYVVQNRSYILSRELPQMQISQVVVGKNHEEQFTAKVIRQLLWSDDVCYELKEIYGLAKSSPGSNENGSGKECVICMAEQKNITVLPCRHMCMCKACAKVLSLQSNKCPICRETIGGLLVIKIDDINQ